MRIGVTLNGSEPLVQRLDGAGAKIRRGWKRGLFQVGARSVALMQAKRRAVTQVRSGVAVRSYGHEVQEAHNDLVLGVGAIKPGPDGKVPLHVRVQEARNAAGERVDEFKIAPIPPNTHLHFPIRRGPGLSESSIVAWVTTSKTITLTPTPVIDDVAADIPAALRVVCGAVFADVLGQGEAGHA